MKKYSVMLLALALSCASLASYVDKRPEASIDRFDIAAISFKDVDLLFDIAIKNPYPIGIKLDRVKVRFDVEGKKLFETATVKGLNIRAMGRGNTQFIVKLEYDKIQGVVRDYMNREYLKCDVVGEIAINLPKHNMPKVPHELKIPFSLSKNIPAVRPEVSIRNFSVKAPSVAEIERAIAEAGRKNLSADRLAGMFASMVKGKTPQGFDPSDLDLKLEVNFDFRIRNKTKSKLSFNSMGYDFSMNSVNVFSGNTSQTRMEGDTLVLTIANQMSSRALGKGAAAFFKQRKGAFRMKGETMVQFPASIRREPLKLQFDESGGFNF